VSDFICDVEIAARRSLSPLEYQYWLQFYQSLEVVVSSRPEILESGDTSLSAHIATFSGDHRERIVMLDKRVRQKLGARLIEVRVFPMNIYNAVVDTSRTMVNGTPVKDRPKLQLIKGGRTERIVCMKAA
jgi:hypothetical protein